MKTILICNLFLFYLVLSIPGYAQLVLVTGNVINEKTGSALENVNILESFSGIGTITNLTGYFSLMLKPGNTEIVITHDGFKEFSKKMVIKNDTVITVSLMQLVNIKSKSKVAEHQKTAGKLEKEELILNK